MTGPYPPTLREAHDEIRKLRADLLAIGARIQTRELWEAEPMEDVRRRYVERERLAMGGAQGVGEEVIWRHAADGSSVDEAP